MILHRILRDIEEEIILCDFFTHRHAHSFLGDDAIVKFWFSSFEGN